ncbi:phospholipase A1 member A isoform X1 [Paramormyrops kingsleyae]|uniref:Phospholipase A1 member A n=1 Tax=Paramormyrops kingsleyae TaxID=1676925 RepID=A0A3B3QVG4_9TELE|nr:phospholipase A1 member A isoform X1 [Paramormyrops kingsleyae]
MLWMWSVHSILPAILMFCMYSTVRAGGNESSTSSCADFNSTFWKDIPHGAKLQVQYLLFTRSNAECPSYFSTESLSDPGQQSLFNSSLPTKVIIHGYRAPGTKPSWVSPLAQALLRSADSNVLAVDWVYRSFMYSVLAEEYKEVALHVSALIKELKEHGSSLKSIHLIGMSLGAHVAGFIGTLFEGKVGRITGLDPAGPSFKGHDRYNRLDPTDALFVEAIHSDTDVFGISIPVGHVSFFLNGGKDQPGCTHSLSPLSLGYVVCDHMRAIHVYISALNGSCRLWGFPCPTYKEFLNGQCLDCKKTFNGTCPEIGLQQRSGIIIDPLPQEEKLFLLTTNAAPFCTHHILLELQVWPLSKSAEVQVTLSHQGHPDTKETIKLYTKNSMYKQVMAHPVSLCEVNSIHLKNTGAWYQKDEIHFMSLCISELLSSSKDTPLCVGSFNLMKGSLWSHELVRPCESQ